MAIEDGERKHNQGSGFMHEHVLFVVPDVHTVMIDGEWRYIGGAGGVIWDWKIASSDLTLQPSWLYKVPQTTPVQIVEASKPGLPPV